MKPTNELRFIERDVGQENVFCVKIRVLQQWWEEDNGWWVDGKWEPAKGEWRDVPLVQEK